MQFWTTFFILISPDKHITLENGKPSNFHHKTINYKQQKHVIVTWSRRLFSTARRKSRSSLSFVFGNQSGSSFTDAAEMSRGGGVLFSLSSSSPKSQIKPQKPIRISLTDLFSICTIIYTRDRPISIHLIYIHCLLMSENLSGFNLILTYIKFLEATTLLQLGLPLSLHQVFEMCPLLLLDQLKI